MQISVWSEALTQCENRHLSVDRTALKISNQTEGFGSHHFAMLVLTSTHQDTQKEDEQAFISFNNTLFQQRKDCIFKFQ